MKIGIAGYGPLGMGLVDGVLQHEFLSLAGVFESDPLRVRILSELKIPFRTDDISSWAADCDLVLATDLPMGKMSVAKIPVPVLFGQALAEEIPAVSFTSRQAHPSMCRMPCADAIAFRRLLEVLGRVDSLFSSCACRMGFPGESSSAVHVDALEPLFLRTQEDKDIEAHLRPLVNSVCIRRTRVPYTHSHFHHLKIDLHSNLELDNLLRDLDAAPRIRVASGFANTGQLQEFDRDLGSRRGERSDVFVWRESIHIQGCSLFLTLDVAPDTTPTPEILDAVGRFAEPGLSDAEVMRASDAALSLGVFV